MLGWLAIFAACPKPAPEVPEPPSGLPPGDLILLHTNDLHGHFLPDEAKWLAGAPEIGGMLELDAWVKGLEAEHTADDVLLLDAGDCLTGTPLIGIQVRGVWGGAMIEFMEELDYDAWVLGNHEFDKGFENIARFVDAIEVPTLSSNLDAAGTTDPAMPELLDAIVLEANGVKVGVIGATTESLTHLTAPTTLSHMELRTVVESVSAEVARLGPEVDLLVALTHLGLDADRELAEAVPELDIIVGGHSHTRLEEAVVEGDTYIVQTGSYTRSLGMIELSVADGELTRFEYGLIDMLPGEAPGPPSEAMSALVEGYKQQVEAEYGQVIGEALVTLGRSYSAESDLGNWITDVLRESTGAEVGLYNTGGIRADLSAGPIDRMEVFEIFPFGNQVVTFDLTGAELLSILVGNAMVTSEGEGGLIPMSGATLSWRKVLGAPELVDIQVAGEPLDPERIYHCVSNSYVVQQAERYLRGAAPRSVVPTEQTVFDAAVAAILEGPVGAPSDPRIVLVK